MSTFPVILNLNDTSPPPKPDTFAVEYQLGNIRIDPNTGNVMGDSSGCYRTPHVGGVVVLTEDYQLSDVDSGWTFVCNSATPFTLTLQGAVPILPNPEGLWNIKIRNLVAGAVTLDPNGLNLDGSASTVTINQGDAYVISTDGTDYYSGVVATAAGSSTLAADTDVSISSPADRDLLIYH